MKELTECWLITLLSLRYKTSFKKPSRTFGKTIMVNLKVLAGHKQLLAGTKIAYSTGCILKIQTLFYVAVNKLALNKDGGRTLHLHDKYIIIIQLYQSCHIILCFCSTVILIICIFLASDEKNTFVITPLVLSKLCDSHEKSKSQCSLLCSRSFSILVN